MSGGRAGFPGASSGPVSYTHLDVYKRQQPDYVHHVHAAGQHSGERGTVPVSYTHLFKIPFPGFKKTGYAAQPAVKK